MRKSRDLGGRREGYHWFRGWTRPSAAQRRVLDELISGGSNAEIAARLGMSEGGVKWHLDQLREELDLPDRSALGDWWRGRSRQPALLPLPLVWRLAGRAGQAPIVVVPVAVLALVAWLAYGSLTRDDDSASIRPSEAGSVAVVVLPPTPTPTVASAGAVVFDVDSRRATILPGAYTARRWLDTRSDTFVATGRDGPAIVDSAGEAKAIVPPSDAWGVSAYVPLADQSRVLLLRIEQGRYSVLDATTMTETKVTGFDASLLGNSTWAIDQATGALALTDPRRSVLRVHYLDGRAIEFLRAPAEEGILHVAWSPDGRHLLALLGRRTQGDRIGMSERFVILNSQGQQIYEDRVGASWAGSGAVLVLPASPQAGGALRGTKMIDIATGGEIAISNPKELLCVSPDTSYGVYSYEEAPGGPGTVVTRQEMRRLSTDELVMQLRTEQRMLNCDWTPDGRRVVLSPGGK